MGNSKSSTDQPAEVVVGIINEPPAPRSVYEAIVAVMREVGYVQKTASKELRYTYAGEADLIAAVRPSMVAYGLHMFVVSYRNLVRMERVTRNGTAMIITHLEATIRFFHAPTGTSFDVEACGEGMDSGDKSLNKAMTDAYKYAIRQTFCLETGDDPDRSASEPTRAATGENAGMLETAVGGLGATYRSVPPASIPNDPNVVKGTSTSVLKASEAIGEGVLGGKDREASVAAFQRLREEAIKLGIKVRPVGVEETAADLRLRYERLAKEVERRGNEQANSEAL